MEDQKNQLNEIISEFQEKFDFIKEEIINKDKIINEQNAELEEKMNHVKNLLVYEKDQTEGWIVKFREESDEKSQLSQKIIDLQDELKNGIFSRNNLIIKLEESER